MPCNRECKTCSGGQRTDCTDCFPGFLPSINGFCRNSSSNKSVEVQTIGFFEKNKTLIVNFKEGVRYTGTKIMELFKVEVTTNTGEILEGVETLSMTLNGKKLTVQLKFMKGVTGG